ncbi:hypothetical protein LPB248_00735 [Flavobacterium sp. LPB0248]|uniref:hypothetical protein n=1 Tax=Flavobacterium sp. LPB0248 TaxID=2614441 RepID=UPI0015A6DD5D|nr:hypothetical protein [Flavobacterium sp. LPB0248]QLC64854.1 hypothetical protein LPB248_00735 [Flavobacterium sp. LPB0248]
MIRRDDFISLRYEVEEAINEAFDYAKNHEKNENDYILFLSRSYYYKDDSIKGYSPWQFDRSSDELYDRHRVDFLLSYLNQQYNFQTENSADSKFSLTIEFMIYCQIWESKHNLYNLKKLADLCDSKDYSWNIDDGKNSKAIFIKNNILNSFQKHNLKLYELMKKAYSSQLRNAFSHSLFNFGIKGHNLYLENYDGRSANIEFLSYDDWTIRFLTSTLIQNCYHNKFSSEIESLEDGKEYEVIMEYNGEEENGIMSYDRERRRFNGRIK